ncbi:hypothetical protein [Escherichia phage FL33]|uniref:Uncharacterized protein n=2 Tax=Viruses TaxID=10239 RepID=A0AAU6NUE6_9VIRU
MGTLEVPFFILKFFHKTVYILVIPWYYTTIGNTADD